MNVLELIYFLKMLCELGNSVSLLKCVVTHEGQGLKLINNKKDEGFNMKMCGFLS